MLEYEIGAHARIQMRRRDIPESLVRGVLADPEQRHLLRPGRELLQSRTEIAGKIYLVRIIVDVDRRPAEVVTAYRTSRIGKYWRTPS
ncbi:MAG TPA: DUF4258 domain-containing protein [Caulobacteraceae bacterium]